MNEGRRLVISGLVQGVAYRYSMVNEAKRLGATGWVRNRFDGSVEALIFGAPEVIAALIKWAQRGPPAARVEHVSVEWAEGEFTEFTQTVSV